MPRPTLTRRPFATTHPASAFRRSWIAFAVVALVQLTAALPADAANFGREVLGAEATVYRLLPLDDTGNLLPLDSVKASAFVLEVVRPGQPTDYLMVPGTEDFGEESAPSLSFFAPSNTLHLVWVDQINPIHSMISAVAYRPDTGFDVLASFMGSPYYTKLRPQVVGTQDRATWTEDVETTSEEPAPGARARQSIVQRVFHTVWREEQGHVFYSAIAESGHGEAGRIETLDLNELLPALPAEWRVGIDGPMVLSNGKNTRTVLLSVVDPESRTLETIEIETIPVEMAHVAEAAHAALLEADGAPTPSQEGLVSAAEEARSHIIRIGRSVLSQPAADLLAREAAAVVTSVGAEQGATWVGIAEEARSHIIRIGRSLRNETSDGPPLGVAVVSIPMVVDSLPDQERAPDAPGSPSVYVFVSHLSSVALPEAVPIDAEILRSADGLHSILFWTGADGTVEYVEHEAQQWSSTHRLTAEMLGYGTDPRELFHSRLAGPR